MNLFKKKAPHIEAEALIRDERKNLLTRESDFFVREAYKTLRTNVAFAMEGEGDTGKILIVTSSHQGEGKSITTINLAISCAMTDRKVLVIDCDLRRPKLARLMDMNAPAGLSNLIIDAKLKDQVILHTETQGLDVMLSGSIPPNPSELLGSKRMQTLLQELRSEYDYIFLDTPPVNVVTDAVLLAPKSDGVIFVVRANQAEQSAVKHAVNQLKFAKAKILGFVLNDVSLGQTAMVKGKSSK